MNSDNEVKLKKIDEQISELDKRIDRLEELCNEENIKKLESLIEKVDYIEEFLTKRTRGFYGRNRR